LRIHPFERPLDADAGPKPPRATRGRERPCICDKSPFCRGALSADWPSCAAGCATCQPEPWRPPTRTPADGEPRPIMAENPS